MYTVIGIFVTNGKSQRIVSETNLYYKFNYKTTTKCMLFLSKHEISIHLVPHSRGTGNNAVHWLNGYIIFWHETDSVYQLLKTCCFVHGIFTFGAL